MPNPIGPAPPSPPPGSPITVNVTVPSQSQAALDTLEQLKANEKRLGTFALIDYVIRIEEPSEEYYQQQIQDLINRFYSSKAFYVAVAQELESYITIVASIFDIEGLIEDAHDEQLALHGSITPLINDYNSGTSEDTNQINAVNTTLNALLDGIDQGATGATLQALVDAYNTAVTNYTNHRNSRNPVIQAYNNALPGYASGVLNNANAVAIINDSLTNLEITTLMSDLLGTTAFVTERDLLPPPPPLADIPTNTYPVAGDALLNPSSNVPTFTVPDPPSVVSEFLEDVGIPSSLTTLLKNILILFSTTRGNFLVDPSFLDEILRGGGSALRDLFINGAPEIFLQESVDTDVAASGTGVQASAMALNVRSSSFTPLISKELFLESLRKEGIPNPPFLFDQILALTAEVLAFNLVSAVLPGLKLLGDTTVAGFQNDSYTRLALGVAFGESIVEQIEKDEFRAPVSVAVRNAAVGLPEEQSNNAINLLTGIVNSNLLNVAFTLITSALGIDGLPAQVLRQVEGLPATELLLATAGGSLTINDVLSQSLSVLQLKLELLERAEELGLDRDDAANRINTAIDELLASGPFVTEADLRKAALERFLAQGFSPDEAEILAGETTRFTRGEIDRAAAEASVAKDQITTETINAALDRAFGKTDARGRINNALDRVLDASAFSGLRGFREASINELVKDGFPISSATNAVNAVIQEIAPRPEFSLDAVNTNLLTASVTAGIGGGDDASNIAENIVSAAVSANPASTDQLRDNLRTALTGAEIENANGIAANAVITTDSDTIPDINDARLNTTASINELLDPVVGSKNAQIAGRATNVLFSIGDKYSDQIPVLDDNNTSLLDTFKALVKEDSDQKIVIGPSKAHSELGMQTEKIDFPPIRG